MAVPPWPSFPLWSTVRLTRKQRCRESLIFIDRIITAHAERAGTCAKRLQNGDTRISALREVTGKTPAANQRDWPASRRSRGPGLWERAQASFGDSVPDGPFPVREAVSRPAAAADSAEASPASVCVFQRPDSLLVLL